MLQTRLRGESTEYRDSRERLRVAELELMRAREQVAEIRRQLPEGPIVEDYVFEEGPRDLDSSDERVTQVRLSQLFSGPDRSLVVYHFMYGKKNTAPCDMCTMLIDGLNGVGDHLAHRVDFAIVAAADVSSLRRHARNRGWRKLRLLSAAPSSFKYDLYGEDEHGQQNPGFSVFKRDRSGAIRHFYTGHAQLADDVPERGVDMLCPVYNVFDLTPEGRGDWFPSLSYEKEPALAR
jgi:predicted dithiol-disulfide oxidoreductase (DUF899 family)